MLENHWKLKIKNLIACTHHPPIAGTRSTHSTTLLYGTANATNNNYALTLGHKIIEWTLGTPKRIAAREGEKQGKHTKSGYLYLQLIIAAKLINSKKSPPSTTSTKYILHMLRMETRLFAVASLLLPLSSRAFFFVSPPPSMIAMGKSRAKITATGTATATIMPKMRVSGIESTPNPSSFKFDLDEKMHGSSKGVTYTVKTGQGAPEPIQRVLELEGVESVYALGDWLCLNKAPSAKWDKIVSGWIVNRTPASTDTISFVVRIYNLFRL